MTESITAGGFDAIRQAIANIAQSHYILIKAASTSDAKCRMALNGIVDLHVFVFHSVGEVRSEDRLKLCEELVNMGKHLVFAALEIRVAETMYMASIYGGGGETSITLPFFLVGDGDADYTYDVFGLSDGTLQLVAHEDEAEIILPPGWKRYERLKKSDHSAVYLKTDEIPHGIYEIIGPGEKTMTLRKFGV